MRHVAVGCLSLAASAQCGGAWQPGGFAGVLGPVHAATQWDPDGQGPLPPRMAIVGSFELAGTVAANSVVAFDAATQAWSALGVGIPGGTAFAVVAMPNGDLVVGGAFASAGGVPVANIARWDGSAWSALGAGFDSTVRALAVLSDGSVVAAGEFATSGGMPVQRVARWDGTAWMPIGTGITGAAVYALQALPNGALAVGGSFTAAGGVAANGIATWNGAAWSAVGPGTTGVVRALARAANGDLLAGGVFAGMGSVASQNIARWNGSSWSGLGAGVRVGVLGVRIRSNGEVLVAGTTPYSGSGASVGAVARWDGVAWSQVVNGPTYGVFCLATMPTGTILLGGDFRMDLGQGVIWLLPNNGWGTVTSGFLPPLGQVQAVCHLPDGGIAVGGYFFRGPSPFMSRLAILNGSTWTGLNPAGEVYALAVSLTGDLIVGGCFDISSLPTNGISSWRNGTWTGLGSGISGCVYCVGIAANGDVLAGGSFHAAGGAPADNIARWNGTSWNPLPGLQPSEIVLQVAERTAGDVVAIVDNPRRVMRWQNGAWTQIDIGATGEPQCLTLDYDGELVVGRNNHGPGGGTSSIVRWNGMSWLPIAAATGGIYAIRFTPDRGLVAAGNISNAGGVPVAGIARWDGSSWHALGAGLIAGSVVGGAIALSVGPAGDIAVGGGFAGAGGMPSQLFAHWQPACPAAVASAASGCSGAGAATLRAVTAPWGSAPFTMQANGLPANSLAIAAVGLSPLQLSLSAVLPQGLVGCTLWVSPDVLTLHVPSAGSMESSFSVPSSPALTGVQLRCQVVALELNGTGDIVSAVSTNALLATIGAY